MSSNPSHTDNDNSNTSAIGQLTPLGKEFQRLRQIQGHYEGGDHKPEVDNQGGRKQQILEEIKNVYGKGKNGADLIRELGHPDTRVLDINELQLNENRFYTSNEDSVNNSENIGNAAGISEASVGMPGPFLSPGTQDANQKDANSNNEFYYLVYKWRGYHDYLYFKINANNDQIVDNGWYHAYE